MRASSSVCVCVGMHGYALSGERGSEREAMRKRTGDRCYVREKQCAYVYVKVELYLCVVLRPRYGWADLNVLFLIYTFPTGVGAENNSPPEQ